MKEFEAQGKFVIINFKTMDYMKDSEGNINLYDTAEDACIECGMYEFENVWVVQLIYNHIEKS